MLSLNQPLPFEHVLLNDDVYKRLCNFTDQWANQWLPISKQQKDFVNIFLRHCSPKNATPTDLELPSIFLIWFVAFNDLPSDSHRTETLTRIQKIIESDVESEFPISDPFLESTKRFLSRINEATPNRRIRYLLANLVAATIRETEYGSSLPDAETYLSLRKETVAVYPYFELFRLQIQATLSKNERERFEQTEHLSVKTIAMVNDILSVKRDIQLRKLSFVRCLADERTIPIKEATKLSLAILEDTMKQLLKRHQELSEALESESFREYSRFLLSIQEGNRAATFALRKRYNI